MARTDWNLKIGNVDYTSRLVSIENTLTVNRPGTLRIVMTGQPLTLTLDTAIEATLNYWQAGSVTDTWTTGKYYLESLQQLTDTIVLDCNSIRQSLLSQNPVTFTDQNLNSIANSLTSKLGLTGVNFAAGTAFRAGLAVSGIASCIVTGKNEFDAIQKAAAMYGYGYFIHNNTGYLVDLKPSGTPPNLTRNNVIDIRDVGFNSIDAVKQLTNIKYKSNNTLPTVNLTNVLYGRTFDATNDGFHETLLAAQRAAVGYQLRDNAKINYANILAIGRAGYLPGSFYGLSNTEFNALVARSYFIQSVTQYVDGESGWTSQLRLMGAPQAV